MDLHQLEKRPNDDGYLFGRGPAWFAFAMTIALMVFDYVDRQVIVSLFPFLKAEWGLSDDGQRAWGSAPAPSVDDVATWIERARRATLDGAVAA